MGEETPPLGDSKAAQDKGTATRSVRAPMTFRKRLWRAVRIVGLTYLALVVLLMIFEERIIFVPSKYPVGEWENPGVPFEDADFSAADGTKLHGWFVPHDSKLNAKPTAVVLIAHGNAGNLTHRAESLKKMRAAGAASMIFDYRGYGKSEGSPNEDGILADARAARVWLANRTGVPENKIVLFGESLGGGVMVDLAATDGAGGLILLSTFTSLPDVAANVYPWIPVRYLMRTRLDSLAKIGQYTGPVLQLHGDRDEIVPFALGEQLFDAVPDPDKRFVKLPGGTHNMVPPRAFDESLKPFFARL
jgi:fermentation-respiration switch protein FrsA (DUF1100 family)